MTDLNRRVKDLVVGADTMLEIMLAVHAREDKIRIIFDLPRDVKIIGVHSDWETSSFSIRVMHQSFAVIPHGMRPPRVPITIERPLPSLEYMRDDLGVEIDGVLKTPVDNLNDELGD